MVFSSHKSVESPTIFWAIRGQHQLHKGDSPKMCLSNNSLKPLLTERAKKEENETYGTQRVVLSP